MQNRSPQAVITLLSFALLFVAACTYLPPAHPTSPLAPAVIAQAILIPYPTATPVPMP